MSLADPFGYQVGITLRNTLGPKRDLNVKNYGKHLDRKNPEIAEDVYCLGPIPAPRHYLKLLVLTREVFFKTKLFVFGFF